MSDRETYLNGLRSELTKNQRIFCDEYLIERNGTQSYLIAYPNVKSEETAAAAASRLLSNVKVKEYIDEKLKNIAEKAEITVERVLKEEGRIAFSDMRQLFSGGFTQIAPGDLPEEIARAVAGIEIKEREIFGQEGDVTGIERIYKYKLWDKGASLNRLEKHLGMHQPSDAGIEAGLEKLGNRLASAIERMGK